MSTDESPVVTLKERAGMAKQIAEALRVADKRDEAFSFDVVAMRYLEAAEILEAFSGRSLVSVAV